MMKFSQRSYTQEFLDRDDIPFNDIKRNMQELDVINTWLGGHGITLSGIKELLQTQKLEKVIICEIGCGGGDNLCAINKWCEKNNVAAFFIGIDINAHCISYARERNPSISCEWITSDYAKVMFDQKPHIIFSSLFCHHFSEEQLQKMFQWMHANSSLGFFINDLHRNRLAYYSIKILTAIFSRSYLVKNDAPLSVLRGFSKSELNTILSDASIHKHSIKWKWAFRWLIIVKR
ncbi:methyltransferase domain-containing protein [Pinibacter sp. MAH-24]|uniref:Methyltransferase domain-containing protein n=2 Tax=Pinibacter soli TaxID=3044211 RepID=A0ABT6R8P2_9BACT|nr:methyltransferase domain-containing protein [Pinibacter soli]